MNKLPYKLALIIWEDHSGGDGWNPLSAVIEDNERKYFIHSVGWVVAENEERITIVPHISGRDNCTGEVTIIKKTIESIKYLKF